MLKGTIKTVSDFLEYLNNKYSCDIYQLIRSEFKFFISVIKHCVEKSDLSDEDKLYKKVVRKIPSF